MKNMKQKNMLRETKSERNMGRTGEEFKENRNEIALSYRRGQGFQFQTRCPASGIGKIWCLKMLQRGGLRNTDDL